MGNKKHEIGEQKINLIIRNTMRTNFVKLTNIFKDYFNWLETIDM